MPYKYIKDVQVHLKIGKYKLKHEGTVLCITDCQNNKV